MFTFAFSSPAQAGPLRVTVFLSEEGGAYQEFGDLLRARIQNPQLELNIARAGDPQAGSSLLIAVGMKAASALSSSSLPVLNVWVPRAGFERLQQALPRASAALYLDQPMERQLALIASALPDIRNIGVLYSTAPKELAHLRQLSGSRKFALHEQMVDHDHPLASALSELLEKSEVLMVLPDAEVYSPNTIRNILLETYSKHVPLIGLSQSYVRAGALCAVYSTPEQIAQQVAEMVDQFITSGNLPRSQYPKEFNVSVNVQVARSLGLVIKDAEQLRDEVRRKQ